MEEFSQWLNAQLKKHGLTANGFAQKAGMNSTSIKNYTKGRPVKPDQEKKIRDIFRAIESGEDFQADEQPINPGVHSDGYNPLKEAYEQLMERVRMLESYNEDLREDKKHLQEDKKRLERKNTALLKKMGVPVDEESFNETGFSSLSVVHRNMQVASKQGA